MINFAKKLEPIEQLLRSEKDKQKREEHMRVLRMALIKMEYMRQRRTEA